jgi:ribosomal 30S subunit maturation factor RimM
MGQIYFHFFIRKVKKLLGIRGAVYILSSGENGEIIKKKASRKFQNEFWKRVDNIKPDTSTVFERFANINRVEQVTE